MVEPTESEPKAELDRFVHRDAGDRRRSGSGGPWMNFTWFASAYDTDDVLYRLLTFVQIAGVLVWRPASPRPSRTSTSGRGRGLRDHAARAGRAMAARRARRPAGAATSRCASPSASPPSRSLLDRAPGLRRRRSASRCSSPSVRSSSSSRSGRSERVADHVAPGPHRRTLRTVHDHRPRRVRRLPPRWPSKARDRRGRLGGARGGRGRRAACWCSRSGGRTSRCRRRSVTSALLRWMIHGATATTSCSRSIAALGAGLQVAVDAVVDPEHLDPFVAALTIAVPAAVYLVAIGVLHRHERPWTDLRSVVLAAVLVLVAAATGAAVGVPSRCC